MEQKNAQQIEFIRKLLGSLNDAMKMQEGIYKALEIGGVLREKETFQYIDALNTFLSSGLTIILEIQLAFGDTYKEIAAEAIIISEQFAYDTTGDNSKLIAEETLNKININD